MDSFHAVVFFVSFDQNEGGYREIPTSARLVGGRCGNAAGK